MHAVQADRSFPDDSDFFDTRNIQEPAVKGGGVSTGVFYGSNGASTSGRPQAKGSNADDEEDYRPDLSRRPRPPPRNHRKQAQQVGRYAVQTALTSPLVLVRTHASARCD